MIRNPLFRPALLAGVGFAALTARPAFASENANENNATQQTVQEPVSAQTGAPDDEVIDTGGAGIVVRAQRLRGQLDVEQAPLLELAEADIAAEGVTSVADLITQITAQTGSSRGRGGGGQPVILINGIRVGSFREFANYPPEALARVEVFPEEVAQRFGFPPDRRVINLILKDNYRNTEVEFEFEGPSRGGFHRREQEVGFLQIADGARINANFTAQDTSFLTEDERDIIQTPGSVSDVAGDPAQAQFRSLVADSRSLDGNLSWAKAIIDSGMSLSANASYERNDRRTLQGLNTVLLTNANGDSALRVFGEDTPLEVRTSEDAFRASGSLTKPINAFRLTSTFDAGYSESTQEFDRRLDTSGLQADALNGTLAIDGTLPTSAEAGFDTARTRSTNATTLTTLQGPLANLPGGEVLATFDVGYDWTNLKTSDTRNNLPVDLTRGDLSTGVNLVVPITSRRNGFADALGSFTLNAQLGLNRLSDFGTLGDYTVGLNWSPFGNLDLSVNYIEREVAPGLRTLGDPEVEFLNTPVFDFVNGETVLATVVTGGNPNLLAETQRDWKFAVNWELPFWEGTRFGVEYIRNRSDDVTRGFPTITSEIEAAFPDRIRRDADGRLTFIDRRAVTFAEERAERINFSLNFRGSIGAGEQGGRFGGGRPGGGSGGGGRPGGDAPAPAEPTTAPAEAPATPARGGPPSDEQRAAFMQFRERICADDGMDVLMRLIEAVENGEDLSSIVPGFDAQRFQRLLAQARDENGNIDPERVAAFRTRICSFDPATMGGGRRRGAPDGEGAPPAGRPGGAPGGRPTGPMGEGFAAFRAIACGEDGEARIRALIARIDAGEDVSDELPGFDPNMAGFILDRLRGGDGQISSERIAGMRARFCSSEGGQQAGGAQDGGQGGPPQGAGGPPAGGFNPLAQRSFRGFRYFVSLNHTIELENEILIAPGLAPLDQLDGQGTGAFGFPRHSSRLEAGIFGAGVGMRLSGRYTGETRLAGSGLPGSSDLFFGDLATFDIRIFTEVGQLVGKNEGALKNLRISLRADNLFDAQRRVTDQNGDTPLNYQPLLIDPVGRYLGLDIRKLF
ncbi:MAG: hypothetical protein ACMUJI_14385 [Erythrobacter sp.]|uniref:hypothetical protein n=1 Tax=Erythrobacter sp. TaxID=1042 RepID=UPI003A8C45AC